ncbi:hypothetical protein [Methylocystis sp. SC2]|nr:hypothetical protein [Methylocystis sp. SC2]
MKLRARNAVRADAPDVIVDQRPTTLAECAASAGMPQAKNEISGALP